MLRYSERIHVNLNFSYLGYIQWIPKLFVHITWLNFSTVLKVQRNLLIGNFIGCSRLGKTTDVIHFDLLLFRPIYYTRLLVYQQESGRVSASGIQLYMRTFGIQCISTLWHFLSTPFSRSYLDKAPVQKLMAYT